MSKEIGRVLGTNDAEPLGYWVAIPANELVQLDDVVCLRRQLPDGKEVAMYGLVDSLVARHEGAHLETDVFLAEQGVLPLGHSIKGHVTVTRVEPEIFVPPLPGQAVFRAVGVEREQALFFDGMRKRFPLGLSRDGEVIHGNFEFLDGTRGAHVNISGISGVATKTTYATFLLYGIFHSELLGAERNNTRAIIFNVKGEDLLFLDQPNQSLTSDAERMYVNLGLPTGPFDDVAFFAPVKRGEEVLIPDTGTRAEGVTAYSWSIEEFCKQRYLRFLFADADAEASHLDAVIDRVEMHLANEDVSGCKNFLDLKTIIESNVDSWAP